MIKVEFTPNLNKISIKRDMAVRREFLRTVVTGGKDIFKGEHFKAGRSKPGQYLHKDTGELWAGTSVKVAGNQARLGSTAIHAAFWVNRKDGKNRLSFYDALLASMNKDKGQSLRGYLKWHA